MKSQTYMPVNNGDSYDNIETCTWQFEGNDDQDTSHITFQHDSSCTNTTRAKCRIDLTLTLAKMLLVHYDTSMYDGLQVIGKNIVTFGDSLENCRHDSDRFTAVPRLEWKRQIAPK